MASHFIIIIKEAYVVQTLFIFISFQVTFSMLEIYNEAVRTSPYCNAIYILSAYIPDKAINNLCPNLIS